MDPNRSELYTLYLIKWRFIHRKMHLNKSTIENDPETSTNCTTETSRKITSRVQFIFCNYVFSYIKIDLLSENQSALTSWIQSFPLPVYLRAVWSSCCCGRCRCHSAASILSSQGRTKSTVCSWSLLWDVLWAWKEVRPRMRIIALLFIVLFISSSEDMPYCGHKVRAENGTQYWCRVRATEIIHS